MNKKLTVNRVVSPSRAWIMSLCALAGASAAGAVSAAAADDAVPTLVVRYQHESLATDAGARALYYRLETAAKLVCPALTASTFIVSSEVAACRQRAVARAVAQIDNPRLAAVYSTKAKNG